MSAQESPQEIAESQSSLSSTGATANDPLDVGDGHPHEVVQQPIKPVTMSEPDGGNLPGDHPSPSVPSAQVDVDELDTLGREDAPENLPTTTELLSNQRILEKYDKDKARDHEKSKSDEGWSPGCQQVRHEDRERVKKLFAASPDYEAQQEQGLKDIQLYWVYGPKHADKLRLAVHLGMTLTGEVPLLRNPETTQDVYVLYERQASALVSKFEQEFGFAHPQYLDVTSLRERLRDNIHAARQHGDNRERESIRSEIIEQLHRISILVFHLSLEKLDDAIEGSVASPYFDLQICTISKQEERALTDYVQHSDIRDNTVYILENGFQKGVSDRELSPEFVAALAKRKIAFIITESRDDRPLGFASNGVCAISSYPEGQLERHDFIQHSINQYYKSYLGSIPSAIGSVLPDLVGKFLQASGRIDDFFEALISRPANATASAILELADEITGGTPVHWHFATLSHNAKLYAMLVLLMENVPRFILDEIYIDAVTTLREKDVSTLKDPREFGMNDLLIEIRAYEGIDRLVYFRDAVVAQEVDRQINNHYHLLWLLLETILNLIENFQARQYWAFRKALGATLGRFGMYRMEKLRPVLTTLALHSSGGVVAVAGYAMDRICRSVPDQQPEVVNILQEWVDSKHPDLMWAVGASLWRIYDGLLEMSLKGNRRSAQQAQTTLDELNQIFTSFAEKFDRFGEATFEDIQRQHVQKALKPQHALLMALERQLTFSANNIGSILHAVRQIFAMHPESIVAQVNTWLNSHAGLNQHFLGVQAGRQLFRENAQLSALLSERHLLSLLELLAPLITGQGELSATRDTVDIVTQALLQWLNHPEWVAPIQSALLRMINRCTADMATLLSDSIARYWLKSDHPPVQQVGQALMLRAYAVQGIPLDMPSQHAGLILVDAAEGARANQEGAHTGLNIYQHFAPWLDLYLRRMGDRQLQITPGQSIVPSDLQLYHALPALMMPPLEASALPRLAFILVLTWDKVIDAADLGESTANRLVVASFGDQALENESLWPKQTKVIAVQRDDTGRTALDQAVNQLLAQTLANQSATEWWSGLEPYLAAESAGLAHSNAEQVVHQLQTWLPRLDQLEYCRYPNDLMRIMVYAAGWLAKTDLALCIETLQNWLDSNEPNQRLVGAACGRSLFTLFMGNESPPPLESYAQLLQLAPLLGQQNWDAAQTILQAAYRWSVDPDWQQRLLLQPSGSAGELLTMIDKTATKYNRQMSQLFDRWMTTEPVTEKRDRTSSTSDFVEQLRLRLALSSRQPLPGLLADGVYGLILVDTAVHNPKKRWRLVNIAAKVIEQLTTKLQQHKRPELQLLIYWLGRDHLVAGPGEKPVADTLMPTNGTTHPRLFGPLLERFTVRQIGFVLVFTDELPNDAEDWHHSELQRHILFYTDESRSDWATMFTVLPQEDSDEDKIVVTIVNYLLKRAGG